MKKVCSPSVSKTVAALAGGVFLATILARKLLATPPPQGSVVLITGGSRGLGLAIASRFAERPVKLVLAARHYEELEQAQATLLARHSHLRPDDFHLVAADVAEAADCRRMVAEAIGRFGRIDVLINNAGIIEVGPMESMTIEDFEHAMRVIFFGSLYTTWSALPSLLEQQPRSGWNRRAAIVNISSVGGKFAVPHMLPYSAAKFGLTGFSAGLHAEVRGKGVRVTTVCPGLMRTGGEEHAHFKGNVEAEAAWFKLAAKTPGIATTPEHAAERIFQAVAEGRAEITITPQAWLGARVAGLMPETLQWVNSLANDYILPNPS